LPGLDQTERLLIIPNLDGTGSSVGDTIQYIWTLDDDVIGNDITQQIFGEGEYVFTVVNLMNNCISAATLSIEENIAYPIANAGLDMEITCADPTVTLDASNSDDFENIVYSWSGPIGATILNEMTIMPTVDLAGEYVITVVDTSNMCTNLDSVMVIDNTELPTAVINGGFTIDCITIDGTLDGTGSSEGSEFIYQWSNNAGVLTGATNLELSVDSPDTYTLEVTNVETSCVNEATIIVDESTAGLPMPVFSTYAPTCFNHNDGSIDLDSVIGGEPPYLYSLEGQNFTSSSTFNNLLAGDYVITVEDAIGCQSELEITVKDGNELSLYLGEDQFIGLGDSTELVATPSVLLNEIDTIMWEVDESLSCLDCFEAMATPFFTTTYSAQVIDENGCTAEDFVMVVVDRQLDVYVPTAFSPDGDGINDIIMVYAGEQIVKVNTFIIYDRWGEQVFEYYNFPPNESEYGWDGYKGLELMNQQVFVYHIEVERIDGTTETVKGDFTLIK